MNKVKRGFLKNAVKEIEILSTLFYLENCQQNI